MVQQVIILAVSLLLCIQNLCSFLPHVLPQCIRFSCKRRTKLGFLIFLLFIPRWWPLRPIEDGSSRGEVIMTPKNLCSLRPEEWQCGSGQDERKACDGHGRCTLQVRRWGDAFWRSVFIYLFILKATAQENADKSEKEHSPCFFFFGPSG